MTGKGVRFSFESKEKQKTCVRPEKISKLIFPDCCRFSYARKLLLRLPSYRRRLFVVVFKPVRQNGSRGLERPKNDPVDHF